MKQPRLDEEAMAKGTLLVTVSVMMLGMKEANAQVRQEMFG